MQMDARLSYIIIGTVCAAWLILTLASIFTKAEVPASINGLFLAIAGAATAKLGETHAKKKKEKAAAAEETTTPEDAS